MPSGQELSPDARRVVLAAWHFLEENRGKDIYAGVRRMRELVGSVTGLSPNTVEKVRKLAEEGGEASLDSRAMRPGRPPKSDHGTLAAVRAIVQEFNRTGRPLSLPKLSEELKKLEISLPGRTLARRMHDWRFHYGRGRHRSRLHEDGAIVRLRVHYLEARMRNRRKHNLPKLPEVFLDESYCNLHHTRSKTWLETDGFRDMESGLGPRYCIVAAGVYWAQGDKIHADFVKDSMSAWDASKKSKTCHNIFRGDDDLAGHVAGGETDATRDYHGNFNAELFEFWFEKLCQTLRTIHGQCLIHMDGASYHKRRRDPPPTTASSISEIKSWLTEHGAPFHPEDRKMQLLARIPAEYKRPRYASLDIAERYGHLVLFTPPYHPELEPIEIVWAVIKNKVAEHPAKTMAELGEKLIDGFRRVTQKTWLGARKKTTSQEDAYWRSAELDLAAGGGDCVELDVMEDADASVAATIDSLSTHNSV
jgi:hypothetical protein